MSKPNIILLPALMTDERLFCHQKKILSETFNVIIPVIKDISNISEAAKYVLSLTKEDFYLSGISMGGYIAMEIMRQSPQRVKKLCLINTTWLEDSKEKKIERLNIISEVSNITDSSFIGVSEALIEKYIYKNTSGNILLIKDMAIKLTKNTLINQQKMILSRPSSEQDLPNYNIPTLIITGEQDTITSPELSMQMFKSLKDGEIIILDECKHLSPLDQKTALSFILKLWFSK
jgi:pimeloyl-ACP methyl ester carboxylesterase